eukprot:744358-Amphidinium_carterae.1
MDDCGSDHQFDVTAEGTGDISEFRSVQWAYTELTNPLQRQFWRQQITYLLAVPMLEVFWAHSPINEADSQLNVVPGYRHPTRRASAL